MIILNNITILIIPKLDHMERKSINFEVLRVISMFFIVIFHFIVHGISTSNFISLSFDKSSWVLLFNHFQIIILIPIVSVAVNCYILISGYFLSEKSFKLSRLSKIWIHTFFYSTIICILINYFYPENVAFKNIIGSFTPIKSNTYWFVTKYIALLALSPFLTLIINKTLQNDLKKLLIILSLINITLFLKIPYGNIYGGETSLLWFIFLYLVGGYIKKYGMFENYNPSKILITTTVISIAFYFIKSSYIIFYKKQIFNYSDWVYNGITFFVSLSLFLWIKQLNFNQNIFTKNILRIAPYTFGVYLIHDNIYFRTILWDKFTNPSLYIDSMLFLPYMLSVCSIIFFICLFIDYNREHLFRITKISSLTNTLFEKIIKKITEKVL